MELGFIKNYLKVDFDDDDEYILLLKQVAKEYVEAATGKCDEEKARVRLLMLSIICDLYDNRGVTPNTLSNKAMYTINSIIRQLQLED